MQFAVKIVLAIVLVNVGLVALGQDITPLLRNRLIVERQIGCVLKRNPCDFIGNQIKGLLPEALNNKCARCTPQQRTNARKLMAFMKENHPEDWNSIVVAYKAR